MRLGHQEARRELVGVNLLRVGTDLRQAIAEINRRVLLGFIRSSDVVPDLVSACKPSPIGTIVFVEQDRRILPRLLHESPHRVAIKGRINHTQTGRTRNEDRVNRDSVAPDLLEQLGCIPRGFLLDLACHPVHSIQLPRMTMPQHSRQTPCLARSAPHWASPDDVRLDRADLVEPQCAREEVLHHLEVQQLRPNDPAVVRCLQRLAGPRTPRMRCFFAPRLGVGLSLNGSLLDSKL